jgi:tetratricopeptide (TPR) repeat protein
MEKDQSKLVAVPKLAFALIALLMLCTCALSLESAGDWYGQGQMLYKNGSYQESLSAYDEGLKTDPQNASAWHYRGLALAGMGHGAEANQSIQKAIELLDQRIQEDPKDIEALWLKAEGIDLLGRSEEALEAYGIVADLNSSHALGAMIRESDILAALGRYNQSAQAFGRAMALVPANRSQSQLGFQRHRENTFLFTKAWLNNGQIHRVSNGLYNLTSESFDEIEQINSDFVAALQLKGKAIDASRHGGSLMASSLNCDVYIFNIPKMLALAWPPFLTITRIDPTGNEFIEISNDLKETTNLQNWSLKVESSNITLPEHFLLPGKAVRIHLGSGQENETDLFLNSNLELNDTVGNVSLRDGSGEDVALLNYWTKLDGSIGYSIMAKGDFEYPAPDAGNRELLPENKPTSWIEKGLQLYKNESYQEAASAFDKAIELDPQNLDAWLYKSMAMTTLGMKITGGGMNLGAEDREASRMAAFGTAMAANDRAVEIAPENATVWIYKAGNLDQIGSFTINLSLLNESLKAFDRALELDPNNADAWHGKGVALVHLSQYLGDTSRYEEALRYYDRALELDPQTEGVLQNKAGILVALGRQNESAEAYAQVIEAANTSAEQASAWHSKGDALTSQGEYRDAVDAYNSAAEIDPKDRWTWMMMAFATDQIGWYNRSLEAYDAVLSLDADSSSAMYGKADALYRLRRFNESLQAFDAALKANPERSSSWKGKGDALKALNRTDEAESAYEMALNLSETAIRIDANSSDPWIEKGEALRGLGRFDEALLAYEKAIELPPVYFPVWQKKGDLLMEMGRYDEALTTYEKALEMDTTFPRLWYYKGLALWALSRGSEAEEAFAKATEMGYDVELPLVKEAGSGPVVTTRTEIAPERLD